MKEFLACVHYCFDTVFFFSVVNDVECLSLSLVFFVTVFA